MREKNLSFLTLLVCLLACGLSVQAELIDGIAAVVNDRIITYSDLRNILGPTEDALRRAYRPGDPQLVDKIKAARKDALDQLIERQLILEQFNDKGGTIPENIIEEDVKATIDDQYGGDRSVFIRTIEALGMSLETYKERTRDKIIVRYMQQHEVGYDNILISPYKIETYYKEHKEDFREGAMVRLRMLYIKKSDNPEEREGARSLAQELLLKLTTGSDFRSLSAVYSEGPEKKNGGDLGFVTKDTLREELREPAFNLMVGQLSPVIETADGFYIIQVLEKKDEKIVSPQEARDLIEQKLMREERERLANRWVLELKRKAFIRYY